MFENLMEQVSQGKQEINELRLEFEAGKRLISDKLRKLQSDIDDVNSTVETVYELQEKNFSTIEGIFDNIIGNLGFGLDSGFGSVGSFITDMIGFSFDFGKFF